MKRDWNIGLIGQGFMGRAHANGWRMVEPFFSTAGRPVLKAVADPQPNVEQFAEKWGFEGWTHDWRELVERKDIDIIDIVTPTFLHKEMVLAAAANGKHILCEKPCALTSADAQEMADAAEKAGVLHYLNHNYRRVPAIAYAKRMMDEGRLGRIFHMRSAYQQDWLIDPDYPVRWQLKAETAGGGPLYDLASHAVDLCRYLLGEPEEVYASLGSFIKERPVAKAGGEVFKAGKAGPDTEYTQVTVDDAAFMVLHFAGGVLGSLDVSRYAAGHKNDNHFEICGEKGSLRFHFEAMNELQYCDFTKPETEQGFTRILVTEPDHPYTGAWWGPGHVIGYENTFVHAFADFIRALEEGVPVTPNLYDGVKIIRFLEAAKESAASGRMVEV